MKHTLIALMVFALTPALAKFPHDGYLHRKKGEILKGYNILNSKYKPLTQYNPFLCNKKLPPEERQASVVTFSLREKRGVRRAVVNFYRVEILDSSFFSCAHFKSNPKNADEFRAFYHRKNEKGQPYYKVDKQPYKTLANAEGIFRQAHSKDLDDPYYVADIMYKKYMVSVRVDEVFGGGRAKKARAIVAPNPALGEIESRQLRDGYRTSVEFYGLEYDPKALFGRGDSTELDVKFKVADERAGRLLKSMKEYYARPQEELLHEDRSNFVDLLHTNNEFHYFKPVDRRAVYSLFDGIPNSKFLTDTVMPKAMELAEAELKGDPDFKGFPKAFKIDLQANTPRDELQYRVLADRKGTVYGVVALYLYNDTDWWETRQDWEKGPFFYNEERECYFAAVALVDKVEEGKLTPKPYQVLDHRCYVY